MIRPLRRRLRKRDERGAMAILLAGLMTALIVLAAMGVDLGNAWQRKVTVQKSVDVVALSAGALLPKTATNVDAIYSEVATYLNKTNNKVTGQPAAVTAAQLHDNNLANGEVTFPDNNTMKVVAPNAHVDYGLANLIGIDSAEVSAASTVQVRTPLPAMNSVLPMWLPSTCVYGPLAGDIAASPSPSASPTYTPPTGSTRGGHGVVTVNPVSVPYATTNPSVTLTIDKLPKDRSWAVVRFTFGNTQYVDYQVTFPMTPSNNSTVTVTISDLDTTTAHRVPDNATVSDPNNIWTITSTAGKWQVWPLVPKSSAAVPNPFDWTTLNYANLDFPKNNGEGIYEVTGGGQVACNDHTRGNFGQLDSPRKNTGQKQTVYAENVAFGLDHLLAVYANAPSNECQADGNPIGAKIDDDTSDGNNCLYVDPGNDPQGLTDGLLGGGRITEGLGRLQKPTSPMCSSRPALVMDGKSLNNDVLSCFLKPGYTLADITKDAGVPFDALDVSIYDSPRFFWVPVVYAGDRMLKKYLAIKTFAPVFLTDETGVSAATGTNGLVLNPGGKVQSVQIFGFNQDALPIKPNAPTTDYQPGGRGVIRMVN